MSRKTSAERVQDDQALLIETATIVKQMDKRLFGENGDGGFVKYVYNEHEAIKTAIDVKKTETESKISTLQTDHQKLKDRVNRWAGALAVIQFLILAGLTIFAARLKAGH